jgi:hypothetical protein
VASVRDQLIERNVDWREYGLFGKLSNATHANLMASVNSVVEHPEENGSRPVTYLLTGFRDSDQAALEIADIALTAASIVNGSVAASVDWFAASADRDAWRARSAALYQEVAQATIDYVGDTVDPTFEGDRLAHIYEQQIRRTRPV